MITVLDLIGHVVHSAPEIADKVLRRHRQPLEGIDEGRRIVGGEDLGRRMFLVVNIRIPVDIGGRVHAGDVVSAPKIVIRHGEKLEDRILALAGQYARRHMVRP